MKFVIICHDKPGSAALRRETCGSLLIVEAADRAEAERITANDPYTKVGLFESTTIRNYRVAILDGLRVS